LSTGAGHSRFRGVTGTTVGAVGKAAKAGWGPERAGAGAGVAAQLGGVIGLLGGCGGAGSSSLSAALAAVAFDAASTSAGGRRRTSSISGSIPLLVDLDPSGGGVDVALGAEGVPGARWSGLHAAGGRLDPDQLLDGLPRWHGIPFLACDGHVPPAAAAVRSVIHSGREIGPVVLDLGRATPPARTAALELVTALVIVVPGEIRAVTAAATVRATVAQDGFTGAVGLVVRTDGAVIGASRIAEVLDLTLAGCLGNDPGLRSARDRGVDPRRLRRGTRNLARALLAWAAAVPDRPAAVPDRPAAVPDRPAAVPSPRVPGPSTDSSSPPSPRIGLARTEIESSGAMA
jgi:secretion/DNA translocation related CpaE-like protein